jgi:CBS domain-containing protein
MRDELDELMDPGIAAVMSDNGIRHVPVEADGKVLGMVSARDILRAVPAK